MSYGDGAAPYTDGKRWSNDYLTDPKIVRALGPFDLDPCCPKRMPWRTAKRMFCAPGDDGLALDWRGRRAFMNPPYRGVLRWARKFAANGSGIALLNGRSTETRATQLVMERSTAIWFPLGRLTFFRPSGKPYPGKWFPSLLIGLTALDARKLEAAAERFGGTVYRKRPT